MNSPPSPRQQLLNVCATYVDALQALTVHRQLGMLSESTITRVDTARGILNPICSGPSPTTPEGQALGIQAALTRAETALAAIIVARRQADGS